MNRFVSCLLLIIVFSSCKHQQARYPVLQKTGSSYNESVARNKKLVAKEEKIIKELIAKDSTQKYLTSNTGFWYYYNNKIADSITTKTPVFGDIVTFNYSIKTLDDKSIYSEKELSTKQYAIDKEKLFSGLREGLKLMKEGETVTFLFPSYKAYGYYGDHKKIRSNTPIKTKVSLRKITPIETKSNSNKN
ncbi:gliding motility-associated peptidyl-prolyl isomerase GldI [Zunongwangia sp.]|uniref:gliding motility-associated peptidyl-prolyl isomerase GldI n=1 Tax=Zunongwangia sp. TaxID=1965325 RepID=UPI003AA90EA0